VRHPQPVHAALGFAAAAAFGIVAAAQVPDATETFDAAWTIVRDSHFDKALNGVDWNAVRTELRPRASAARTPGDLRVVIRDMLGRLGQSHFALIPATADTPAEEAGDLSGDPGFDVRVIGHDIIVSRVEPGGGAANAGVRTGWRLTAIGNTPASALLSAVADAANERLQHVQAWSLMEKRLRGPARSTVEVTFDDVDGKSRHLAVERLPEAGQPVTVGNLPTMFVRVESEERKTPGGATAGIIRFNVWMAAIDGPVQNAVDAFRGADGIVIDLRGNPGGLAAMMMGISGHFLDERKPLGVMKTRENELRFVANPRRVSAAGERVTPYAGPVAILVDALSGSASECFAGGMQSLGRARVFGQVSMGQALPALFDRLPNGDVLIHAYGDFVTATGTRLEGRGVVPDEIVPLTRAALAEGRDATLEAALAWIEHARTAAGPSKASRAIDGPKSQRP
jgi:carboxyl-terminal processing protease